MIILLSPAKTLDESPSPINQFSKSQFTTQTAQVLNKFKKLSTKKLESMMKLSPKLAQLTHDRFQNFNTPLTKKNAKQAMFLFKGPVFLSLNPLSFTEKQLQFAQKHLRILSGLYGILRPLDLTKPYRLEMKYVTTFWQDILPSTVDTSELIINLASKEYADALITKHHNTLHLIFKQPKDGTYKTIGILAKKARGLMTRYIIQNAITNPQGLKGFNLENYQHSPEQSSLDKMVFLQSKDAN